jgi:hypothetical protein
MTMKTILLLTMMSLGASAQQAADFPGAEIASRDIRAKIYLPDRAGGFYRGTRFDWSGVIHSLQYAGHDYYGPWFQKTDPKVHDFIYDGADIVAGPCSGITGPVDEFGPLGYAEAKPGGTFVKVGVGALRRPDAGAYDNYHVYEIADPGVWTIGKRRDSITFTQKLTDSSSGYAYVYRKTLRLTKGKPEMVLEHSLKNTGTLEIKTSVYNHNFLVLDKQPPGPDLAISLPFAIRTSRPAEQPLAEIRGNRIVYVKTLTDRERFAMPVEGFGDTAKDNEIRIENPRLGAGMKISSDRPLSREYLWSIRAVVSVEPFIAVSVAPGAEFTWTAVYTYYTLPAAGK